MVFFSFERVVHGEDFVCPFALVIKSLIRRQASFCKSSCTSDITPKQILFLLEDKRFAPLPFRAAAVNESRQQPIKFRLCIRVYLGNS